MEAPVGVLPTRWQAGGPPLLRPSELLPEPGSGQGEPQLGGHPCPLPGGLA